MRTRNIGPLALAMLAAIAVDARADERGAEWHEIQDIERLGSAWHVILGVGTSRWDGLSDAPSGAGGFDTSGMSFSGQAHRRVLANRLLAGGEIGLLINKSNIEGVWDVPTGSDEVSTWSSFMGPSLRWLIGKRERVSLDFGVGHYDVEVIETVCLTEDYTTCFDDQLGSTSGTGRFFGVTGEFPMGSAGSALSLSVRSHHFDAGEVSIPSSGPVSFDGPLLTMQVGWTMRFGRR